MRVVIGETRRVILEMLQNGRHSFSKQKKFLKQKLSLEIIEKQNLLVLTLIYINIFLLDQM